MKMTFKRKHFYASFIISVVVHLFVLTVLFVKPIEQKKDEFTELKIKLGVKKIRMADGYMPQYDQPQNAASQLNRHQIIQPENPGRKVFSEKQEAQEEVRALAKAEEDKGDIKSSEKAEETVTVQDNKKQLADAEVPTEKQKESEMRAEFEEASRNLFVPETEEIKAIPSPVMRKDGAGYELGNSTDEDAKDLMSYEQMLPLWLNQFRKYPEEAKLNGMKGAGEVFLKINRNGKVLLSKVIKSTGHEVLDKALMQMIADADPVIPVPSDYYEDKRTFSYKITFDFEE